MNISQASLTAFVAAGSVLALSRASFAQSSSEFLSQPVRSAHATASANNIPVWFEGFGETANQKEFAGIRIQGKLARALYQKGVFLVLLHEEPTGKYSYSGDGSIFLRNDAGDITKKDFQIPSFSFDYVIRRYDDFAANPQDGDRHVINFGMSGEGNESTALYLRRKIAGAVSTSTGVPALSPILDNLPLTSFYYPHFKDLVKRDEHAHYVGLRDLPALSSYLNNVVKGDLQRFHTLSSDGNPKFLQPQCDALQREVEKISWLNNSNVASYVSATWQSLHPQDAEIKDLDRTQVTLLAAIRKGIDRDFKAARSLSDSIESSLKIVEKQEEVCATSEKFIQEWLTSPSITEDLSKQLNAALKNLKKASEFAPEGFSSAHEEFQKTTSKLKAELNHLEEVRVAAEEKRIAEGKKREAIQKAQHEQEQRWTGLKNAFTTFLQGAGVVVGGVVVIVLAGLASTSSSRRTGASSTSSTASRSTWGDPYQPESTHWSERTHPNRNDSNT